MSDTTIHLIHLHPKELDLIKHIRSSLRFGEVTIQVRDGLPVQLIRIQEFINLKSLDTSNR